ncbi:MAG: hypothetical protein IT450_17010 [Phycisphaerales bacterium]|nr:hypothetical protein [Phycisphaerales bacterium]
MSTLHGRTQIGPDGTFRIALPSECAGSEVEYVLEYHPALDGSNGRLPAGSTPRKRSGEARREALRRVAGTIDDPTFERPPQGEADGLESME